jgi:hypothetical protein
VSTLENGKASPRIDELENMATHFRTTAFEMILEANSAQEGFVPLKPRTDLGIEDLGLDDIAADLDEAHRELAREFLIFLRERERVDKVR